MSLVTFPGPIAYVDDLDHPRLSADDAHHLQRVLRVPAGKEIVLCDGNGSWQCFSYGRDLRPISARETEAGATYEVGVSVAMVKGERPEWMVQKLTEIGVDRITFLQCDRSVVTWPGDRAARNLERFRRIARSAGAQSRRARLPRIEGPVRFATVADAPGAVIALPGGGPVDLGVRNVLIGPEGGWTETERRMASQSIGLSPQILRSETAGVVAATLLVLLRSQVVVPAPIGDSNALGG